ncbi:MAG: hypothetical protein GIKADHBN_01254 [Phycisphaerales bacterium]|nr:hypothetical protein [Phycisphaerales bacterium]
MHPHAGHPQTTSEPGSLSFTLRESTAELHTQAERSALQRLLVTGRATREQYAQHLAQMLVVHRALDSALRSAATRHPAVATVVRDEHYQEPYLIEDLAFLGVDAGSIEPVASAAAIVEEIKRVEEECPAALLGYHYVLEGANNGNRYIAKAVAGSLSVRPGEPGTRYLDPYGERQRPIWAQFKVDIDSVAVTERERARIIECARRMFEAVARIGDEVMERCGAGVVVLPVGPAVGISRSS